MQSDYQQQYGLDEIHAIANSDRLASYPFYHVALGEFEFRCVYCRERKMWSPDRHGSFSVDHIVPQSANPHGICDYENIVYACTRSNSARREVPILDPTTVALAEHLEVDDKGVIRALTKQ